MEVVVKSQGLNGTWKSFLLSLDPVWIVVVADVSKQWYQHLVFN